MHVQPNRELFDVLETAMGARSQPLLISITTSDYEREGSICNEKHDYASKVRDGVIDDPTFLPVIYEASIEDDWTKPATWKKANPNYGKSVRADWFKRKAQKAADVPSFLNTFLRMNLNIRTASSVAAIPDALWMQNADPVVEDYMIGREC